MDRRTLLLSGLAAALLPGKAAAQRSYPDRPIRMVVPFAPGGATDVAGRVVADALTEILGQPVVVENRSGSGGNIGVTAVATSAPDGYTLMMGTQALLTQNPYLYVTLAKNPQTDLVPVANAFKTDMILVASPRLGITTVPGIVALARAKPDTLNYGSAGNGSAAHILMELLKSRTGSVMRHVPYRGTAQAMTDLVAGTLDLMIDSMPSALGQIQGGNVVPIAVCGPTRNPRLPAVPTMTEAGIKDYQSIAWLAVFAPTGTPEAVVSKLEAAIKTALVKPQVLQRAETSGLDGDYAPSADLGNRIASEAILWSQVIKAAGIKL
jgi:tripartite-type tricarboxylate transporter receptor subunit TctC